MGAMKAVERVRSRRKKAEDGTHGFDGSFLAAEVPMLWELLSTTRVDGKIRKTSSVTFFFDEGYLKCCLSDPDTAQKAFFTFEDGEDPFRDLEAALEADKLDWRTDKPKR